MPRQIHVNGMRAIILYNVFKQNKRLTKENKKEIIDFVNTLSIENLKEKGLTKQITSQFKDGKPRKNITGGMFKRKRTVQPWETFERHPLDRLWGFLRSNDSINDEVNTVNKTQKNLKDLIDKEREAKENYEHAKVRTRQAQQQEYIAQTELEAASQEIKRYLDGIRSYIPKLTASSKEELKRDIEKQNEQLKDQYKNEKYHQNAIGYIDENALKDILDEIKINDIVYLILTGRNLPNQEFYESLRRENEIFPDTLSSVLPPLIDQPSQSASSSTDAAPQQPSVIIPQPPVAPAGPALMPPAQPIIIPPAPAQPIIIPPAPAQPIIIPPAPSQPETLEQRRQRQQQRMQDLNQQ